MSSQKNKTTWLVISLVVGLPAVALILLIAMIVLPWLIFGGLIAVDEAKHPNGIYDVSGDVEECGDFPPGTELVLVQPSLVRNGSWGDDLIFDSRFISDYKQNPATQPNVVGELSSGTHLRVEKVERNRISWVDQKTAIWARVIDGDLQGKVVNVISATRTDEYYDRQRRMTIMNLWKKPDPKLIQIVAKATTSPVSTQP